MAGIEDLEKAIQRFEDAQRSLRETVTEAHAVTKDLQRLIKEARSAVRTEANDWINEILETAVKKGLSDYAEVIKKATEAAHQHVLDEFDKLSSILLGKGEDLQITDLARAIVTAEQSVKKHGKRPRRNR